MDCNATIEVSGKEVKCVRTDTHAGKYIGVDGGQHSNSRLGLAWTNDAHGAKPHVDPEPRFRAVQRPYGDWVVDGSDGLWRAAFHGERHPDPEGASKAEANRMSGEPIQPINSHATWVWDDSPPEEMGQMWMPTCRVCGRGPLTGDQHEDGLCGDDDCSPPPKLHEAHPGYCDAELKNLDLLKQRDEALEEGERHRICSIQYRDLYNQARREHDRTLAFRDEWEREARILQKSLDSCIAQSDRYRTTLEKIKDYNPFEPHLSDEAVNWWVVSMDLRDIARQGLRGKS